MVTMQPVTSMQQLLWHLQTTWRLFANYSQDGTLNTALPYFFIKKKWSYDHGVSIRSSRQLHSESNTPAWWTHTHKLLKNDSWQQQQMPTYLPQLVHSVLHQHPPNLSLHHIWDRNQQTTICTPHHPIDNMQYFRGSTVGYTTKISIIIKQTVESIEKLKPSSTHNDLTLPSCQFSQIKPAMVRPLPTPAPSPKKKPALVWSERSCICLCRQYPSMETVHT